MVECQTERLTTHFNSFGTSKRSISNILGDTVRYCFLCNLLHCNLCNKLVLLIGRAAVLFDYAILDSDLKSQDGQLCFSSSEWMSLGW